MPPPIREQPLKGSPWTGFRLSHNISKSRFYPSIFVYSYFSSKIQFLYCLRCSFAPWGPYGRHRKVNFKFRSADRWKMCFSWIFLGVLVSWEILKKRWVERYIQLSFIIKISTDISIFQYPYRYHSDGHGLNHS